MDSIRFPLTGSRVQNNNSIAMSTQSITQEETIKLCRNISLTFRRERDVANTALIEDGGTLWVIELGHCLDIID